MPDVETYPQFYLLKLASCANCGQTITTNDFHAVSDRNDLIELAKEKHRETFGLGANLNNRNIKQCLNPLLLIEFGTALISTRIKGVNNAPDTGAAH